jgi:hypothetical protein
MQPIIGINNKPTRSTTEVTYRPITEQGLQQMKKWLESKELIKSAH